MPTVTLTFRFLDAASQPRNWTAADQAAITATGLAGLDITDPARLAGTRDVAAPAPCASWTAQFDALAQSYAIFADAAATQPVGRDAAPCIGSLIANAAVTLYLRTLPPPAAIGQAVAAAAAAPAANVLANAAQVTAYLQAQAVIRVYIPASKSRGHQATTCAIVRRLIALGFAADFEVVYTADIGNAAVIKLLLPELNLAVTNETINPAPGGGPYRSPALGNCGFTFTDTKPAVKRQFGISGGVDIVAVDPRSICNTDYFLMLQPFQWNAANYLYATQDPQRIDLGDEAALGRLRFLGLSCYWTDLTGYTWAALAPDVQRLSATNQAIVADIQANCCVEGPATLLLPVYGLNNDPVLGKLSNWPETTQATAFANLVLAVLEGQATPPLNVGTVILTLDVYPAGWFDDLKKCLPTNYHPRLTAWTSGMPWNDPIPALANDAVLIVNLPGVLPAPLFNYFYLRSALPPIFEGKGTMPIMLNSGRPYLQLSKQSNGYDTVRAVTPNTPITTLKVFLYPTLPTTVTIGMQGRLESETIGAQAQRLKDAGDAIVRNTQNVVTISANTFPNAGDAFPAIEAYLRANFYINSQNRIQNKFKALLNAADFEPASFPAGITPAMMYADLQTACGGTIAAYRTRITALSTFFANALNDAPTRTYFQGLGTHFQNVGNDKLLKGMGFAVAAIAANR